MPVDDVERGVRRVVLPERLDDQVHADGVAGGEHEQAEEQPSLRWAEIELDAIAPHARSAEDREAQPSDAIAAHLPLYPTLSAR